jgi:potassium-dependent mechanosensitive channel
MPHRRVRVLRSVRGALALALCSLLLLLAPIAQAADASPLSASAQAENEAIAAQADATRASIQRAEAEVAHLQRLRSELKASMQRIDRRAGLPLPGREFVRIVVDQLHELPNADAMAGVRAQQDLDLETASDAQLRTERALAELSDLPAAATRRAAAQQLPAAERPAAVAALLPLLQAQAALLAHDLEAQQTLVQTLEQGSQAALDYERERRAAVERLTRLLFWIPVPPSGNFGSELAASTAWTFSPANWMDAGRRLRGQFPTHPLGLLLLVLAGALLALRGRLRAALARLASAATGSGTASPPNPGALVSAGSGALVPAAKAFAISALLALPLPLLLWTAAESLRSAPELSQFSLALADSMLAVAKLAWALSMCGWLLDRDGLACGHFGWERENCARAARATRRFSLLFVPLLFVTSMNSFDHASIVNRESFGRLAGVVAMIVLSVFLARLFSRRNALVQQLVLRRPASRLVRWHGAWYAVVLAVPLGVALLAGAGYFIAADYFFGRLVWTFFLLLGAAVLYGFLALWVVQQRNSLQRIRGGAQIDAAAAATAAAASPADAGAADGAAASLARRRSEVDVQAIGEQTRSLLDLLLSLLLFAGLWGIWRGSLPALSAFGDEALWSYAATVDGKEVMQPLTVGSLFLALLIAALTAILLRHIGALLDMVLLQRLEVQPDATYAIKIACRYAIVALGATLGFGILGIRWSDVHWLVAALGLGLGFGLQEIVANFVSGLIILAERPIRIGDVVTVDQITGRVSRIRARATAVMDFDNKEVIIPNKAFITRDVVNWTLSNQTTRLVLKVGVAYGSDVDRVQRLLLQALEGEAHVLAKPPPQVYFMGFGDSALDFEVLAYVDSINNRLPARHAINRAIDAALREAGIEIPFPQQDLHLRTMPEAWVPPRPC